MAVDHIRPASAGGVSDVENLCLACYRCNKFKGARLDVPDPLTGETAPLFNPRAQTWHDHFAWSADGLRVVGLTA